MRKLWVVLAVAACGGSSKPAMGPPPAPSKIAETEKAEPVERAAPAPAAAPAPQVASDPEEGGQVASDPEEGGQVASAAGPGLGRIGASGTGAGAGGGAALTSRTQSVGMKLGPATEGDIDRATLQKVIKRNANQLRYCYEKELTRNPSLQGKVTVVFEIAKNGTVSQAKADGFDNEVDRCIENRFKTWLFPKQAAPAQIVYPIVFTPQ